ncbi:MAG: biliverdin-producing heme oxygenase [Candidatus Sumerlaeia bacterium]|nr:biliverdin-producing heme oxygenase [Candidatus Sumerlaeia bacterium]
MSHTQATIMERLKEETKEAHKRAESQDLEKALIKGALPREVYANYIAQRYFIHLSLEKALLSLRQKDARVAGVVEEIRFHSSRAAQDLKDLGLDLATVKPLDATSKTVDYITDLGNKGSLALLGVFYVFEGSTNGARYISMALRRSYGFEGNFGTHYLDPYGEDQPAQWQKFKTEVNSQTFSPEEQELILAGATETFDSIVAVDTAINEAAG